MKTTSATDGPSRHLVILGASVRGLAESASRAGWAVHAADLFCDLDLLAVARDAVRITAGYPRELANAALRFPASAPWCYTGALENHPDVIDAITAKRPLAGNSAALIRKLRDPVQLAATVVAAGLSYPETRLHADGLPTDGTYLVKPLASAGGHGIREWTREVAGAWSGRTGAPDRPEHVWQRFVAGTPVSAAYVMSAGVARLVGVTRQLVGAGWCHAPPYAWCGGVTIVRPDLLAGFERLGTALAAAFHPVGMVGIDAVVDDDGRVSVLEVNPRPTASMELHERSTGISVASSHLAACGHAPGVAATHRPPPSEPPRLHWAKAVIFAPRDVRVTGIVVASLRDLAAEWTPADGGWAAVADIPAADQMLAAGAPICTIFGCGREPDAALGRLRSRAAAVRLMLDSLVEPAAGTH